MQSRLTAIAVKSNWVLSLARFHCLRRGLTTGPTADPSAHAVAENDPAVSYGEPEKSQDAAEPDNAKANYDREVDSGREAKSGLFAPPKLQYASSPRLESTGVGQPSNPITQQKRTLGTIIDDVSCVGIDGGPLAENKEDKRTDRKEQEEDDRDYYKHHKASPLAEIEFADTRKPITQATDGTAYDGGGKDVIGWLPEQVDTAEEALRRATEIWKENAMRGNPDAPQSKVLRALRGE